MSTFEPSRQMRRMQIVALLLLVASGIVNYLDRSALSIANIEVRQELGLSATAMGVLLSAFLMSYAFSQLPAPTASSLVAWSRTSAGPRVKMVSRCGSVVAQRRNRTSLVL